MAAAAPWIGSGIGGILSGIGRSKSQTSKSSFDQNQSSTQEANLSGKQKKVNKALFNQILEFVQRGPEVSQADRNTQRAQINNNFDSANTNLEANLAARGYGESGKMGQGFRDNGIDRAKSIQTGEAQLQGQAWDRFMNMMQSAFQFNQPRSFTSNSTSSGTSSSTMPGQSPFSTIGSGMSDLSSMLFMKQMGLFGGGSPFLTPSQRGALSGGLHIPSIGCRVAMELYGEFDVRTFIARAYLFTKARNSKKWAALIRLYIAVGPLLAWLIRRSQTARRMFKSIFDQLVLDAMNA